jgi:hypothetical protein
MSGLRSSLATRVASGPKTDDEIRAECQRAFHSDGIVCLRSEWLTSWPEKKQLEQLAERAFGKRRGA